MKINPGFELREIAAEHVVVATGAANVDFNRVIVLNTSAAYLWREVAGREFTVEMLADALVAYYEVAPEQALADSRHLVAGWSAVGIVEL